MPGHFLELPTKSSVKKALSKGYILVDGQLATTALFINGGEQIKLLQQDKQHTLKPLSLKLKVVFEDDFLAIIFKPAGVLVNGNSFYTIDNALEQNLTLSKEVDSCRPRPIHRLDYPTSGLLLVGKTRSSIIALNQLFENKLIQKTYIAVTIGKALTKGIIHSTIDNKFAQSEYQTVCTLPSTRFEYLNLVYLFPQTGRKHQLRKHLASIGNPILGDREYCHDNLILKGKGLYLHAHQLEFTHPFTAERLLIKSDIPKKFQKLFHLFPFH